MKTCDFQVLSSVPGILYSLSYENPCIVGSFEILLGSKHY